MDSFFEAQWKARLLFGSTSFFAVVLETIPSMEYVWCGLKKRKTSYVILI
jgi:hypothetical protein